MSEIQTNHPRHEIPRDNIRRGSNPARRLASDGWPATNTVKKLLSNDDQKRPKAVFPHTVPAVTLEINGQRLRELDVLFSDERVAQKKKNKSQ